MKKPIPPPDDDLERGATPGLKTLVKPLAEAIVSSDKPQTLLLEIVSQLKREIITVRKEARRHLDDSGRYEPR